MEEVIEYPQILERVKASFADFLILIALGIGISIAFDKIGNVGQEMRIAAFALILLYDPLFTSLFGRTIGHYMNQLRVRKKGTNKNLPFHLAVMRYAIKLFLGAISLVVLGMNDHRQAIHDIAVDSIVIYQRKD